MKCESLSLKRVTHKPFFLWFLVFLYFLVLSGDLLEFSVGPMSIKMSRCCGVAAFFFLLLSHQFRLIEKKLFFCFLWVLSACVLSSLFSCNPLRGLAGCGAAVLTYVCFFLVPLNLVFLLGRHVALKLYFFSFVCVGLHALSQFVLSFFEIRDPFVTQNVGFASVARGQSWLYEPSYYALFATGFVVFLNTRFLLSLKQESKPLRLWKVIGANILLLASTSTGGFFSYFIFFATSFFLSFFPFVRYYFPQLRKRIVQFTLCFSLLFCSVGLLFLEIFLRTFYKFFHIGLLAHWSFMERWEKIIEGWELFCTSPFWGVGLRNVEQNLYLKAHFNTADVHLYGPVTTREMFSEYSSSSVIIEILASLGIYGLCAFIFLGLLIWHMFIAILKEARVPPEERKQLFSLFVSIIVMIACLQFNQELFRNYIWAHMGISLGYLLSVRSEFLRV